MASSTAFLQLVLPVNGEYENTWDSPLNANLTKIDTWASGVAGEIVDARFTKSTLKAFLEVAHNSDGTLKPTTEVSNARSSIAYGDEDDDAEDLDLADRLDLGDREILLARSGSASLRDGLAFQHYLQDQVLSGAKTLQGYPSWMGFTGSVVRIDGSTTPLFLMAGGHLMRTRVQEEVNLSGEAAGTKYIYAQYEPDGVIRVDGDSSSAPPASPSGVTGSDGTKVRKFTDSTTDFTTKDIEVGDLLEILGSSANAKEYQIAEVAPGADVNALLVKGVFSSSLASLDYIVKDMLSPSYGFDTALTPADGKLYIGEADFDGASVTAVRAMHFKDSFVSEWRAVDVAGGSPTFEEIFNHNLMSDQLDVIVQASQANDGTQPVQALSMGVLDNTLGVTINNTLNFTPGSHNPGTSDATYTPGSLTGTVTGAISGTVVPESSVFAKFSRTQIHVKNAVSAKFYKDYNGTQRQTGFIRVLIRKRG